MKLKLDDRDFVGDVRPGYNFTVFDAKEKKPKTL